MDENIFRTQIKAKLARLSTAEVVIISVRSVLRALPLLVETKNDNQEAFWFWFYHDRATNLCAVFDCCNIALLLAFGNNDLIDLAKRSKRAVQEAERVAGYAPGAYAYANVLSSITYTITAAYTPVFAYANTAFAGAATVSAYNYKANYDYYYPILISNQIENDIEQLMTNKFSLTEFANRPLWSVELPDFLKKLIANMNSAIRELDSGFVFWLDFYRDRLEGKPLDLSLMRQAALIPESIQAQSAEQINAYLLNLREQLAIKPLNRVRAIFLGDGEAGKTSLVKVLFGEPIPEGKEPMTPGIDIREWPVPNTDITAHFWDFGGQVMMHATHQLFLREACLYVLVMNNRSETNATEQAQYWLEHVKSFGGQSAVIIVGNRLDQARLNLDMGLLKKKYPNIAGYFPLSCTHALGKYQTHAQDFKDEFCHQLQKLETHQVKFTLAQFAVLENLRRRTPLAAFLSQSEFIALCAEQNITETGTQNRDWLLDIFDKLGVIIHFSKLACLDGFVLNPRWLTYGIYTVMCHQHPRVSERAIVALLREKQVQDEQGNVLDYPADKCRFIMDAMCQFKLSYRLGDTANTLIIPGLLSATQPDHQYDTRAALAFELKFDVFLPRHIMPQLIVQKHQEIATQTTQQEKNQQLVWQAGVVLTAARLDARALLVADYHERKIQLWVTGHEARDYLTILRDEMQAILDQINLRYEELIALPAHARISAARAWLPLRDEGTPEQASYQQVLAHASKGIKHFIAKSGDTYDVTALLQTFITEAKQAQEIKHFHQHQYSVFTDKEANMDSNNVNIINSTTGDVTVANTIKNSFNKLADSPAAPDVKALLAQLLKEIETLKTTATPAQQEAITDLASDTQAIVTETARATPRKDRLGISLNGIREAAQTVGEIGASVLATAQQLAPLLGL